MKKGATEGGEKGTNENGNEANQKGDFATIAEGVTMSVIALATMDPCAPHPANQRFLIRHDAAPGVTRPTKPVFYPCIRPATAGSVVKKSANKNTGKARLKNPSS